MEAIFHQSRSRLLNLNWDALARARVVLVGLGGVGSHVLAQLAREGIALEGQVFVIDPDSIAESDVARHAIATPLDVRRSKTALALSFLKRFGTPGRAGSWTLFTAAGAVSEGQYDVLLDCTDNDLARVHAALLAADAGIPVVHVGAGISKDGAGGQVVVHHPTAEGGCLVCADALDLEAARRQSLSSEEKDAYRRHGYLVDAPEEPTPMVGHLAAIVGGFTVERLYDVILNGSSAQTGLWAFSLTDFTLTKASITRNTRCPACFRR